MANSKSILAHQIAQAAIAGLDGTACTKRGSNPLPVGRTSFANHHGSGVCPPFCAKPVGTPNAVHRPSGRRSLEVARIPL